MVHSHWGKLTSHSIKKRNNPIKVQVRDRTLYIQVSRVHGCYSRVSCDDRLAFEVRRPFLHLSLSCPHISSFPSDPSPLNILFHFPFSFVARSPLFFNGPPSAPLWFKPAIFYLQAQPRERRRPGTKDGPNEQQRWLRNESAPLLEPSPCRPRSPARPANRRYVPLLPSTVPAPHL